MHHGESVLVAVDHRVQNLPKVWQAVTASVYCLIAIMSCMLRPRMSSRNLLSTVAGYSTEA